MVTFFASAVVLGKATVMAAVTAAFGKINGRQASSELEVEAISSKDIYDDYCSSANGSLTQQKVVAR